mgnify:CR=1 FL=1
MFWLSVSTISVLCYFYCKGKKSKAMQREPPGVMDDPADAAFTKAPESAESSSLKDRKNGVNVIESKEIKEPGVTVEETATEPHGKETSPEEGFSDHAVAEDEDKEIDVTEKEDGGKALRGGIDKNRDRLQMERNGGESDSQESNQEEVVSAEPWEKSEHILAMESLPETADPWEWHTVYTRGIEHAYKNRTTESRMVDIVVMYGGRYLARFPRIKSTVSDHLGDRARDISVFKHLAIVLDEVHAYDDAIKVCNTAISHGIVDGTRTGFAGRIKRIYQKKNSTGSTSK